MLKAKISDGSVHSEFNEKADRFFHTQRAAVFVGGEYPLVVKVTVQSADKGYPAGEYTVDPASFRVGRYGGLEIDPYGFRLIPESAAKVKAA